MQVGSDTHKRSADGDGPEDRDAKRPRATNEVPSRSSLSALYTDGLHSIFKFLSLKELLPAIASCRSWRDAAYKEPSRGVSYTSLPFLLPLRVCCSPLRHHIAAFSFRGSCNLSDVLHLARLPALTTVTMRLRAESLSEMWNSLGGQRNAVMQSGVMEFVRLWPQQLSHVEINCDRPPPYLELEQYAPQQQLVLDLLSCLPTVSSIELAFFEIDQSEYVLDLAPLLRLPHLSCFSMFSSRLHPEHYPIIRQLKELTLLHVNSLEGWNADSLNALCSPPHELRRLANVPLLWVTLTDAMFEELMKLPALTAVEPSRMDMAMLERVCRIPNLAALRFQPLTNAERIPAAVILPHLGNCPSLTTLTLFSCVFSAEEIATLAVTLPNLTELCVVQCGITNLGGLRSLRHLKTLRLHCAGLPSVQLLELRTLTSLRTLWVDVPTRERQLVDAMLAIAGPYKLLPQLTSLMVSSHAQVPAHAL